MNGFEDRALVAEVRARHHPQAADKCGAQIGDDVAVEILQQQHVVLVRIHHQLHAGVVDDVLAISDLGIFLRDVARAANEQAIRQLHDVGFVDGVNLLAVMLARILKGESGNAGGSFLGDDLQALHHAGHDFVLDAGIQSFGVLADDDQIDAGIARRNRGQIANRAKVGEQFELLAQCDIDAGEAAADRRRDRPFQADTGALDGLGQLLRNVLVIFLEGLGAGGEGLPLELDAGGFQNANASFDDFRTDPIAGN